MSQSKGSSWWKWTIGVMIFLLIAVQLFLGLFLGPLVRSLVISSISKNSQGLYRVESMEVDWDLFNRTFSIQDLHITYDSVQLRNMNLAGAGKSTVFTVYAPEVRLDFLDLLLLVRERNARLRGVGIEKPDLQIYSFPEFARDSAVFRPELFYEQIRNIVHSLQIEQLDINGGSFTLNRPGGGQSNAFRATDIALTLINFSLDSTTVPRWDRPFFAEEIRAEANISDYFFILPDSSYIIRAGRLGFSTHNGGIFAEDLNMVPFAGPSKTASSTLEIHLPRLQIDSSALYRAFFNRILDVGKVSLVNPSIHQYGRLNPNRTEKDTLNPGEILNRIQPFLDRINIGELRIENGSFRQLVSRADSTEQMSFEGIDLTLFGCRIDSSILFQDRRLFFSEQIELELGSFRQLLIRNNYELLGGTTRISTLTGDMVASNLTLRPVSARFARAIVEGGDVISLNVPGISLTGLNFPQVYYDRILNVGNIIIREPLIELINQPQVEKEVVDSLAQSNLYLLISDVLKSFSIRRFQVVDAKFNFNTSNQTNQNEFSASNIDIDIRKFKLEPGSKSQKNNPFYAENINITADIADYSFVVPDSSHSIQVAGIGISTADSAIFADSIRIFPLRTEMSGQKDNSSRNFADIFIPSIYLSGLDIGQIWFNKILSVDSVNVRQPKVNLLSLIETPGKTSAGSLDSLDLYSMIEGNLNAMKVRRLILDEGKFYHQRNHRDTLTEIDIPHLSLEIDDFYLDENQKMGPDNLLFARDIRLEAKEIEQPLGDSTHVVSLGNVFFSSRERRVNIRDINLSPQQDRLKQEGLPNIYQVYTPDLTITGLNTYELYEDKVLDVERVMVSDPVIKMVNYPELEKEEIDSLAQADLYLLISDRLEALRIRSLMLVNGQFKFNENNQRTGNTLSAQDIIVLITNFQLDSAARSKTDNPFYADDIDIGINIRDYSFILPDSTYAVTIGDIGVSTSDSSINLRGIQITPIYSNPKVREAHQVFELFIPAVRLVGLNTSEIYFEKVLNLEELQLQRPQITMFTREKREGQASLKDLDLYEAFKPYFHRISLQRFEIEKGNLEERFAVGISATPLRLPGFSVELERFLLDPLGMVRPDRMFYSDNFTLILDEYSIPVKDSIYHLSARNITVKSEDISVDMDSVRFVSNYTMEDYVAKYGFAIDNVDFLAPSMRVESVDLYALLQNQEFLAGHVRVDAPGVDIIKDKTLKRDPDRRPKSPVELVRSLPMRMDIDSVSIRKGRVNYYEEVELMSRPGFIYLDNINAKVYNLTNNPRDLAGDKKLGLNLIGQALIKGEGKLEVKLSYPLNDTAGTYTLEGSTGPMDLTSFNSILEASGVLVRDGKALEMAFRMRGNSEEVRGRMWLQYQGLKVSVIEEKETRTEKRQISRKGFVSALANTVVKSRNPRRRWLRVGKIDHEPDPSKVFVSHWIQGLISGVKSSIGMESKEDKDKSKIWRLGRDNE